MIDKPKLIDAAAIESMTTGGRVLAAGAKGFRTLIVGNRILKAFHKRSSRFDSPKKRAERFLRNSSTLQALGVRGCRVDAYYYLPELNTYYLSYPEIAGRSLREAFDADGHEALYKAAPFYEELHRRGLYFRSGHIGNIIECEDGDYALIDIGGLKTLKPPLSARRRARNLVHVFGHREAKDVFDRATREAFTDRYLASSIGDARAAATIRKHLDGVFPS